jgi:phage baseplate assembly protein W
MADNNSFLGKGWSFPPEFDNTSGSVSMTEGEDDIQSSLKILLSTRLGERIMQPKFGCALDELSFEPLTTTMKTYIKDLIETAILYFEPRIDVGLITLTEDINQGLVLISLDYRIRSTNSRQNLVFPFYKNEGSGVV